jgi:hypothetical protein
MGANNTSFKVGNTGKPRGAKALKTKIKENIGVQSWQSLSDYVLSDGVDRLLQEMQQLSGKEYVSAHMAMLEYFKPKLQRLESNITNQNNEPSQIIIQPIMSLKMTPNEPE